MFIRLVAALRFKLSFKQSRGKWGKAEEALPGEAEERIARNGGKEKSREEMGGKIE